MLIPHATFEQMPHPELAVLKATALAPCLPMPIHNSLRVVQFTPEAHETKPMLPVGHFFCLINIPYGLSRREQEIMRAISFYKHSTEPQKWSHPLISIIVCTHLDRYLHTCANLCCQSHPGHAQIKGFAVNYRSICSLWVVSRAVSFIVANSGAQIQIQLVGCGSHSSLLPFTALSLRAILHLWGKFEAQLSNFLGVVFVPFFFFPGVCITFIFLSHLFNMKTAYNKDILLVLPHFMTEFVLNQRKWRD